jgi:tricorn protease
MMRALLALSFAAGLLSAAGTAVAAEPGYYRAPTLHGDRVVFTAEGDLWSVSTGGGLATRLTSHPAEETDAAFSPDGRLLAFVASYDGGTDVYVMAAEGGPPKRLSFDGGRVFLQGFSPRGEVVYASENVIGPTLTRVLRLVDPDTAVTRTLPLLDANQVAFDGAGSELWFTRLGMHLNADNARDYRGGSAAQLWRWRLDSTEEAQRLAADVESGFSRPMFWQDRIYALGELDGVGNLWSLALDGSDRRPLTAHADFQARSPSLQAGRIVYAHGADLRLYDIASGNDQVLAVTLGSDFVQRRPRLLRKPLEYLQALSLSLDGERAVLSARGQATVAGLGQLRRIDLAAPPRGRLREAQLGKGGQQAYAIVDRDGRSEIWRFAADGSPAAKPLTSDGDTQRLRLYPAPDGRSLAHSDKRGRLWQLDLESGVNRLLDSAPQGDDAYLSVAWSKDSRYLAVARADSHRQLNQIVLIEPASGRKQVLSSDRYESFAPAFSADGRWLYFLSNRSFVATPSAPWGDRNLGPMFDRRTRIYALALQADGSRFPFQPIDELGGSPTQPAESKSGEDAPEASKVAKGEAPVSLPAVEFDGLTQRLHEVPLAAGNFRELAVDAQRLYLLEQDASPDAKAQLKVLAISAEPPKLETLASDLVAFQLSADGRKLLLAKAPPKGAKQRIDELLIVDAAAKLPDDTKKFSVALTDWTLDIDPLDEWAQMFDDAWRMHQAFSFDPGMRGQDWRAVRARYAPLLPRVTDRFELDDLLAQMIAEHGILHSQVGGGEFRSDSDAPQPAALGARIEVDADGLRIERIYRGDLELPSERAPLAQPGVDARDGDRLLAVNGRPVITLEELARAMRQQAGRQVLLTLKRGGAAPHRTVVRPVALAADAALRYGDWVQQSRQRVEQAGAGRIGYLHLRAMGPNDIASFAREFYAHFDREGLIIDVRRNRGGNIDSWIIEKLLRRAWAFWQPAQGAPFWNMQQTFRGHLVVLIDGLTYSDGETFAAGVKSLGLGPLIGTRTAGAGIWLSDRNRLADNGIARIAEFAQFDASGRWLIEGRGVSPDIEVDNLPYASAQGEDAQLAAALVHLQRRMAEQPLQQAPAEPIPARGSSGRDVSR